MKTGPGLDWDFGVLRGASSAIADNFDFAVVVVLLLGRFRLDSIGCLARSRWSFFWPGSVRRTRLAPVGGSSQYPNWVRCE